LVEGSNPSPLTEFVRESALDRSWRRGAERNVAKNVATALDSDTEDAVECGGGFPLHPLRDMPVDVHHEAGRCMTEPLGDDARMESGFEQQRRGRVPEVVESDSWQSRANEQRVVSSPEHVPRVDRRPDLGGEHEPAILPSGPAVSRSAACATRCRRRADIAETPSGIVRRPLAVFGSPNVKPALVR
jgi:hypothetical protein